LILFTILAQAGTVDRKHTFKLWDEFGLRYRDQTKLVAVETELRLLADMARDVEGGLAQLPARLPDADLDAAPVPLGQRVLAMVKELWDVDKVNVITVCSKRPNQNPAQCNKPPVSKERHHLISAGYAHGEKRKHVLKVGAHLLRKWLIGYSEVTAEKALDRIQRSFLGKRIDWIQQSSLGKELIGYSKVSWKKN
jgi:hypothetical protein